MKRISLTLASCLAASMTVAGEADVIAVEPHCNESKTVCKFSVTIEHADTGWDHYADRWDVLGPDGSVLGTRMLRHPHVEEQPFTRSMRAIRIPNGVDRVKIRAHDSVHGDGGKVFEIEL